MYVKDDIKILGVNKSLVVICGEPPFHSESDSMVHDHMTINDDDDDVEVAYGQGARMQD